MTNLSHPLQQQKESRGMNLFLEMKHTEDGTSDLSTAGPGDLHKNKQPSKKDYLLDSQDQENSSKMGKRVRNEWNYVEVRKYVEFLLQHRHYYETPVREKKTCKINILMSEAIQSRNPKQCYSHHSKMLKKYGSPQAIIDKFIYLSRKSIASNIITQNNDNGRQASLEEMHSFSTLCSLEDLQISSGTAAEVQMREYEIEQQSNISYFESLCQ